MGITVDQANIGTRTSDAATNSITLTTTQTVASNAFIVLGIGYFGSTDLIQSVSGGGLAWVVEVNAVGGFGFTAGLVSAQAPSGLASSSGITVTWPSANSSAIAMGAASFKNVKDTAARGETGAIVPRDGDPWSSGNRAIGAGSVLVGFNYTTQAVSTHSPTAPSIEAWQARDAPDQYGGAMAYRVEDTAGSYAVGGTWGGATNTLTLYAEYLSAPAVSTTQLRTSAGISW